MKNIRHIFFLIVLLPASALLRAQTDDAIITIHLRGVYETKISILPLSGPSAFTPIAEVQGVKNGMATQLTVAKEYLPGEFVLRFDYKDKELSTPYPAEKNIFISSQDLDLWAHPLFINNIDSTRFQPEEKENTAFMAFARENAKQKQKIGLLQDFLMNYDDTGSELYKQAIAEYARRRNNFNNWLIGATGKDSALFVSKLYRFQYIQEISWQGTETDRIHTLINNYFEGMDFSDPLIIKTAELNKWMDGYVNLYGQLSTTVALRDSLFPLAGKAAIEKARQGHALVYGWMVDYFYRGFEANNIPAGIKMLEPYINDPDCLTTKRLQVSNRLQAIRSLVPGNTAPSVSMKDIAGKQFELNNHKTNSENIVLLFWSAGCSHCTDLVKQLQPWHAQAAAQKKTEIIAISLDQSEEDIKTWKTYLPQLKTWKHLHAADGITSKVARDYFISTTPQMFLLNATTKQIIALPNDLNELVDAIK